MSGRRLAGLALAAGLAAFAAGFALFVADAEQPWPWPPHADGIVALTGGAGRVDAALALLHAGVAPRLLISGVGQGVTLLDLRLKARGPAMRSASADGSLDADAITLGHAAQTTAGNAIEVGFWVRANGLHSLVLVTAGYHMRRALAEIGSEVPAVRLVPYAVQPQAGARTMLVEYLKLLAAELGVHPTAPLTGTT